MPEIDEDGLYILDGYDQEPTPILCPECGLLLTRRND